MQSCAPSVNCLFKITEIQSFVDGLAYTEAQHYKILIFLRSFHVYIGEHKCSDSKKVYYSAMY